MSAETLLIEVENWLKGNKREPGDEHRLLTQLLAALTETQAALRASEHKLNKIEVGVAARALAAGDAVATWIQSEGAKEMDRLADAVTARDRELALQVENLIRLNKERIELEDKFATSEAMRQAAERERRVVVVKFLEFLGWVLVGALLAGCVVLFLLWPF